MTRRVQVAQGVVEGERHIVGGIPGRRRQARYCSVEAAATRGGSPCPASSCSSKGTTGKFRFSLISTNGQIVATSEAYNSKAAAQGGIRAVKKLAADAVTEDQTTKQWAAAEAARKAASAAKKTPRKATAAKSS